MSGDPVTIARVTATERQIVLTADGAVLAVTGGGPAAWVGARQLTVGFGLMLVSDVVAAHGGSVEIHSRTDAVHHGTAVRLTFPVVG